MPSRSTRRRQHKQLARLGKLEEIERRAYGVWQLTRWRDEAKRRASDLGEPAVWALEAQERAKALALDPSGELAEELSRLCAEAVSQASGESLVSRCSRRVSQLRS